MRLLLFLAGLLLLIVPEFLRVYYIMPFPGSQEDVPTDLRQVHIAYWLHNNVWWIRFVGLVLVIGPFLHYWRNGRWARRIAITLPLLFAALVVYAFNFKLMADRMFIQAKVKCLSPVPPAKESAAWPDSVANSLVIAVERNGDARAYPIELIGYHHQVLDTIGGEATLVTYCTVCRTGRAFEPVVQGEPETFRLVGMDHFNAMFEDSRTGSWWRQVNGECIAGPLKGQHLVEVPSEQLTLREFASAYSRGLVFQPDSNFTEQYAGLAGFDEGTLDSDLEYRDSASWEMKSWVVGIAIDGQARAYDWNDLLRLRAIKDTLAGRTILLEADPDAADFRARELRRIDSVTVDSMPVQAYQEFWHSWRTFQPTTTRYGME